MGLERWMRLVDEADVDGWLVADFRRTNPVLVRLLGLESGTLTRRCFLWLPRTGNGDPLVLASEVDGHTFHGLDCPVTLYRGFDDMCSSLRSLLRPGNRIAMEYSERGVLPTVSRVDGGLLEFVRECGVTVLSSASLLAKLEVWDAHQRELHLRAAQVVDDARRLALRRCADLLNGNEMPTEGDVTRFILDMFEANGVEASDGPHVAVGPHAADPHYDLMGTEGASIKRDTVLLIDLWGKMRDAEGAPYADSTWMAYTGPRPPEQVTRVFEAVRRARDEGVTAVQSAARTATEITGREAGRIARSSLVASGFERYLIGRIGHSLGVDHVHGIGTNLDDVEFPDDRPLLPWSGFTIEPGIYLPGQFGMRLEISAILTPDDLLITTESQGELTTFDLQ